MIVFENPTAFLFFLVIPAYYVLRKLNIFTRIAFPLTIADWKGRSFEWKGGFSKVSSVFSAFILFLAFVVFVFALASPVINHQEKIYTSKGTDVLFVLDSSPSMASRDIAPQNDGGASITRIEAAKQSIRMLLSGDRGTAFGLVLMSNQAVAAVPPTLDYDYFLKKLDQVQIGEIGDGTAIGIGLSSAVYHLSNSTAPKKCIVLITDGENNAGVIHPETAAMLANENNITLYTFGIGTRGTVPMEYIDPNTEKIYSGTYDSKFDSLPLEKLASIAQGRYFGIESLSDLSEALSEISRKEGTVQSFYLRNVETHCYTKLLLLSGLLFSLAWIVRRIFLMEIL